MVSGAIKVMVIAVGLILVHMGETRGGFFWAPILVGSAAFPGLIQESMGVYYLSNLPRDCSLLWEEGKRGRNRNREIRDAIFKPLIESGLYTSVTQFPKGTRERIWDATREDAVMQASRLEWSRLMADFILIDRAETQSF